MAGTWSRTEVQDGQKLTLRVTLATDGTFDFTLALPDRTESRSGRWYVTEGYYKLKYDRIDGKPLSSSKIVYFTCRLLKLEASAFECRDDIDQRNYTWVRVP